MVDAIRRVQRSRRTAPVEPAAVDGTTAADAVARTAEELATLARRPHDEGMAGDVHAALLDLGLAASLPQDAAREFVRQLFDAVHDAGGDGHFATGLAGLISRVSQGAVPAGLQAAFRQLAGEGEGEGGASLGDLLVRLQGRLGYGESGDLAAQAASAGNLLDIKA